MIETSLDIRSGMADTTHYLVENRDYDDGSSPTKGSSNGYVTQKLAASNTMTSVGEAKHIEGSHIPSEMVGV